MESQERVFIDNQLRAKEASARKSECNKQRIRLSKKDDPFFAVFEIASIPYHTASWFRQNFFLQSGENKALERRKSLVDMVANIKRGYYNEQNFKFTKPSKQIQEA